MFHLFSYPDHGRICKFGTLLYRPYEITCVYLTSNGLGVTIAFCHTLLTKPIAVNTVLATSLRVKHCVIVFEYSRVIR